NIDPSYLPEEFHHHSLGNASHVLFIHERHLHVDLSELRLAIRAKVFITKTFHDLEVPVHACHHENLLVRLRRLRQCVELSPVHAARDEVISRTLRGAFHQHRSFDLDKSEAVEIIS